MSSKTFKIGEYVLGGHIKVIIKKDILTVQFVDMFNGMIHKQMTGSVKEQGSERKFDNFLITNGTSYYAGKVMDWIKSKISLS